MLMAYSAERHPMQMRNATAIQYKIEVLVFKFSNFPYNLLSSITFYLESNFFFLGFELKLIHLPQVTDSLTHSSLRIMLLKTWQRWKNHTPTKVIQGLSQQVTQMSQNIFANFLFQNILSIFFILRKKFNFSGRESTPPPPPPLADANAKNASFQTCSLN